MRTFLSANTSVTARVMVTARAMVKVRTVLIVCATMMLSGCFDDVSDIQAYMAKVDRDTPRGIEPIPDVKEFAHIAYSGGNQRSPFSKPKAEAIQDKLAQLQDCLQPDRKRSKEALEKYSLTNLKMKGTMGYADDSWALIESLSDNSLHRVSVGNYMGLFHGRITQVSNEQVHLIEMVPDGTGCYKERDTVIDMSDGSDGQSSNKG